MSQTPDAPNSSRPNTSIPNNSIPVPISPRMKVALLITIILLNTLQITIGALSLPFIYRHSGYGRRGAWARPWNEDGVPGVAIFNGVISILTFGGHGLSELHPRHACYSRGAVLVAGSILFSFNWLSLVDTVNFAWHFLHFGMDGDRDAYWLGVWGVCISCVACATSAAIGTYLAIFGAAMKREESEKKTEEMSETGPLLQNAVGAQPEATDRTDTGVC